MTSLRVDSAAILAGGASTRMGRNKALIQIDGEPLVRRTSRTLSILFDEVVVVTADPQTASAAKISSLPDSVSDRGPSAGIHAALTHFKRPTFIVACDMPWLDQEVIHLLLSHFSDQPALVPEGDNGPEPLHAVYSPDCLPYLQSHLTTLRPPSLRHLLREVGATYLPAELFAPLSPHFRCFANWNFPEDVRDTPNP